MDTTFNLRMTYQKVAIVFLLETVCVEFDFWDLKQSLIFFFFVVVDSTLLYRIVWIQLHQCQHTDFIIWSTFFLALFYAPYLILYKQVFSAITLLQFFINPFVPNAPFLYPPENIFVGGRKTVHWEQKV